MIGSTWLTLRNLHLVALLIFRVTLRVVQVVEFQILAFDFCLLESIKQHFL
jgi:hypothetical protein